MSLLWRKSVSTWEKWLLLFCRDGFLCLLLLLLQLPVYPFLSISVQSIRMSYSRATISIEGYCCCCFGCLFFVVIRRVWSLSCPRCCCYCCWLLVVGCWCLLRVSAAAWRHLPRFCPKSGPGAFWTILPRSETKTGIFGFVYMDEILLRLTSSVVLWRHLPQKIKIPDAGLGLL